MASKKSAEAPRASQTPQPTPVTEMSHVVISAAIPLAKLQTSVSRVLALADSAALTIRGDAREIVSAVIGLSEKTNIMSARVSIRGGASKPKS